jgi:hypothetical protein
MMQNTGLALEITLNTKSRYIKICGKKILEKKIDANKNSSKMNANLQKRKRNFLKKANKNNTKTVGGMAD